MSSSEPSAEWMLPDYSELVRKKTKRMTREKLLALYEERVQEIKAEEEATAAAEQKRHPAPSVLVKPEDEDEVPEGIESTGLGSLVTEPEPRAPEGGLPAGLTTTAIPTAPFTIPPGPSSPSTTSRPTVVASGPYAGLHSAGKRRCDDANPFAPPKRQHRKSSVPMSTQSINNRAPVNRGNLQTLRYFGTLIEQSAEVKPQDLEQHFAKIRASLHQLEFYDFLSDDRNAENLINQSRLLEDNGLPAVSQDKVAGVKFPIDIRLDCQALDRKWNASNFDPHLLRGITTKQGSNKDGRSFRHHVLVKDYAFSVPCSYFGHGELVIGQWWPLQVCAVRDGAHGEFEASIHGKTVEGAYSVVVSGGGYANIDRGDTIEYCGTPGKKYSPSMNTNHLIKSHDTGRPVRVLRSAQLPADNPWRPAQGLRYEGLYTVKGWEILDIDTAMYRFKLTRVPHQPPIRCQGPGVRPTEVEIRHHDEVRGLFAR